MLSDLSDLENSSVDERTVAEKPTGRAYPFLPLHQAALSNDEAWGSDLSTTCTCKAAMPLWSKRCARCRAKNPFRLLLGRRRRMERWLDRRVVPPICLEVQHANRLLGLVHEYLKTLADVMERPFPDRMRDEDLGSFTRRVVMFFESTFKQTSPSRQAKAMLGEVRKCGPSMARAAAAACERAARESLGLSPVPVPEKGLAEQAERAQKELEVLAGPFFQALASLKLFHLRMLQTYPPVREMLLRDLPGSRGQVFLRSARALFAPEGRIVRFGQALWKSKEEREQLLRFDTELVRFHEQIPRFRDQIERLMRRAGALENSQRLSLRKHLIATLARRLAQSSAEERERLIRRIRSQPGVGSWLWRLFHGERNGASGTGAGKDDT